MLPGVVDIQKLEVRRQRCVIGPANNYLLDPEGVLIPDSLGPANNSKAQGRPNLAAGISLYVTDNG